MKFHLETERLILREIRDEDIEGILQLDSDPEVHKYLGNKPIITKEQAVGIIDYIKGQYDQYGIGRWAVLEKSTGAFMGWSGLKYETEVRTDMDYYDLGYRFIKSFWGKGYATETAKVSLEYGFNAMDLDEVYAGAHIENDGSNRVLNKMGFQMLEVFEYDGMPHNWYRLTSQDWKRRL